MNHKTLIAAVVVSAFFISHSALGFEGRIYAVIRQGDQTTPLLYTVGTNFLRIEVTDDARPHPVDIFNLTSGGLTLLFPHNRSFVVLPSAAANPSTPAPGVPTMRNGVPTMPMPAGIGPQTSSPPELANHIGPTNLPGMPAMPQRPNLPQMLMGGGMPAMPMMTPPQEKIELQATDETTNLLGYNCTLYELKQRGETMQIWAADQLIPFQDYVRNQPHRFGPRMMEEQWGGLLKAKKLFPLLATLKFDNGVERYRFEVTSVTAEKLTVADAKLFHPPANYFEVRPLPF